MKSIGFIGGFVCFAAFASGGTIVEYDISSYSGTELSATNLATNVTAGNLTTSGVTPVPDQAGVYSASGWADDSFSPDSSKYYQFTVTADDGHAISYTDITFSVYRDAATLSKVSQTTVPPIETTSISSLSSPTSLKQPALTSPISPEPSPELSTLSGAEKWELHASTDGFACSDIHLFTADIAKSGDSELVTFADQDITALGTQSETVTFRLYGYDQSTADMYAGLGDAGSGVIVGGSVGATPECASLNMLLMGGAGLLVYRRRRWNN